MRVREGEDKGLVRGVDVGVGYMVGVPVKKPGAWSRWAVEWCGTAAVRVACSPAGSVV